MVEKKTKINMVEREINQSPMQGHSMVLLNSVQGTRLLASVSQK